MSNNDINTKNAHAIDKVNNCHHVPCAINYDIITLSKSNHQEHGIEPIPISNQQNVTTLNKSTRTQELLITEASNMEELLDNATEME